MTDPKPTLVQKLEPVFGLLIFSSIAGLIGAIRYWFKRNEVIPETPPWDPPVTTKVPGDMDMRTYGLVKPEDTK